MEGWYEMQVVGPDAQGDLGDSFKAQIGRFGLDIKDDCEP
jgi:hypothetical protein